MRLPSRKWRRLSLVAVVLLLGVGFAGRRWVVPGLIVRGIQSQYHGKVVVEDWWLGWNSSGLKGVRLGETPAADSPEWFQADEIKTDVSLSGLLHGRFMPTRIEIDRPKIDFRIDAKGQPLTKLPIGKPKGEPAGPPEVIKLPEIVINDAEITLDQQGRKPMVIRGMTAKLEPSKDGSDLDVKTDDPTWGKITIKGHFKPSFQDGEFEVATGPGFSVDADKLERIPFIPPEVWKNIEPTGPVDAKVKITLAADSPKPVTVHTELTLKGTAAKLEALQVQATDTTGRVVIDDAMVRVEGLKGKTLDGSIEADGRLDFGQKVPRINLDVRLKGVDVTKAPASWQLNEVGATGRLSGRVDLKMALDPKGPDVTGTEGKAVIEDGSFQGIPIKSLDLGIRAEGRDIQYETLPTGSVDKDHLDASLPPKALASGRPIAPSSAPSSTFEIPTPVLAALPWLDLASHRSGFFGWTAYLAKQALAYEVKHASGSDKGGLRLPKSISTRIELEDVDLTILVAKAKKFGVEVPFPVAGRFSITADATIPLGSLRDLKAYVFKGDATLRGASLDHVDLGLVTAHVDFANGRLDISDFRGQFVDRPSGNAANPPRATGDVPTKGPLPPRAFRAQIHAAVDPRGAASASLEGEQLPLGEVFAPFLPQPTPVSGEASLRIHASADLARVADPKTWKVEGSLDSRQIQYQDAVLERISTRVVVHDGKVDVPDFAARLMGKPLKARGTLGIAAPYPYDGGITIEGWEIAEVLKFVPGVPKPTPVSGVLDAKGEATGSLQPFAIETRGAARVLHARAVSAPVGNLGFQWKTDADSVVISGLELFAFGGKTTGGARIPIHPGPPLRASLVLKGIDTARLSDALALPSLQLEGRADGKLEVTMPRDASTIQGDVELHAPDLLVRKEKGEGIAVRSLLVRAVAAKGSVNYDATADGLGGKVRFHGSSPILADLSKVVAEGELLAVGFRLGEVWKGLGYAGGVAHLDGLGALDANLRASIVPFQPAARGRFELRDLKYGKMPPLGSLKGTASLTSNSWRVDDIQGDLLGGLANGEARSESTTDGSKLINFDFRVERASLARMAKGLPGLVKDVEGFGSLRVAGRIAEAMRASAEMLVPRAQVHGLAITDLRLPVELEMTPTTGSGSIHSRHWTARVAGGSVRGTAWNRFGIDRAFQSEIQLNGVDLEVLSKFHPTGKKPPTGKVSGKMTLNGPDPEHLDKIRGRVDLDLDDASLLELPLFKELDRFLGSSGGGLFEDGDIHGTIANRTLFLEQMTLSGRLVQIHATGSITFNGGLNLEILIGTNSTVSQPELALLNVIPGIGLALGRSEEALRRMTSFLESSLLKFRVSGTTSNPRVQLDPGVSVGGSAVGFFSSVIKLPGR